MKTLQIRSMMLGLALGAGLLAGTAGQYSATAAPAKSAKKAAKQVVYTCAHHPKVLSLKPGKCPLCKTMPLTRKTVSAVYTCAHHPKVVSLKPGKCPLCKMALKKK